MKPENIECIDLHTLVASQNMDAHQWALAFIKHSGAYVQSDEVKGGLSQDEAVDLMRGWFANAIMVGWDAAHNKERVEV